MWFQVPGHLTRLVNYAGGVIEIEGDNSRGLSSQTVWGASQVHNYGSVQVKGAFAIGVHVGNCAPWPYLNNRCHDVLDEVLPNRTTNLPGDVYARNYKGASIVTRVSSRPNSSRRNRRTYGIRSRANMAGRTFAINEGTIDTEGKEGHGILAYGYANGADLDDETYPLLPDYPDTSDQDAVLATNTGVIVTNGEAAHGIFATHYRGGDVKVFNTGDISTTSVYSTASLPSWTAGDGDSN